LPGAARAVFAGSEQSAAILSTGELSTWGFDVGLDSKQLVPTTFADLAAVQDAMLTPQANCAVASHRLYCWGDDFFWLLGDGSTTPSRALRAIPFPTTVEKVGIGDGFACALLSSGDVWCWGRNNDHGQLGDDSKLGHFPPRKVQLSAHVTQLAVGDEHACVLYEDGRVACWGGGDLGALGNGHLLKDQPSATPMIGVANVIQVVAGGLTTCLLTAAHEVFCCGYGARNGDGSTENQATPVKVKFAP
jgi:alpha-tubulin suppressor-like RCC1 family protein